MSVTQITCRPLTDVEAKRLLDVMSSPDTDHERPDISETYEMEAPATRLGMLIGLDHDEAKSWGFHHLVERLEYMLDAGHGREETMKEALR